MIRPVDPAIVPSLDVGPSGRLEPLAGEISPQTPLQLPGLDLEERDILADLDPMALGDGDGLLDRALRAAPVLLPSDLGPLPADPDGAMGAEEPPFEEDLTNLKQEPSGTH